MIQGVYMFLWIWGVGFTACSIYFRGVRAGMVWMKIEQAQEEFYDILISIQLVGVKKGKGVMVKGCTLK